MQESECTYYQVQTLRDLRPDPRSADNGPKQLQSEIKKTFQQHEQHNSQEIRFDFLLNFTKASGLNEAFNYCQEHIPSSPNGENLNDAIPQRNSFDDSPPPNPFNFYFEEVEPYIWTSSDLSLSTESCLNPADSSEYVTAERASYLLQNLQPILERPPFNHSGPSYEEVLSFFSPTNLRRYAVLFWERWYLHCPIVHKPTFDPRNCSILLLATMLLVGACLSPLESDVRGARRMLDVLEDLIFSHPLYSEKASLGSKSDCTQESSDKIQILQATYLMCSLQKWEGNPTAKLRIQRHRFTAFVAVSLKPTLYFLLKR